MKKILLAALMAVTIPCASQVNVQGSNIQIGGSGSGTGNVNSAPQGLIYGQTLSGSQAVANPASKTVNAIAPLLQGIGNTDLFSTSNNGISQFFSSYPTGFAIVPPTSTSTESWAKPPTGATFNDYRGNIMGRVHHNVISDDSDACSDSYGMGNFSLCDKGYFDLMKDTYVFAGQSCEPSGPGYNLGDTGLPYAGLWSVRQCRFMVADLFTRGIKQGESRRINCFGAGDCGGLYQYMGCPGGAEAGADEGCVVGYFSVFEPAYLHALVATGSTGATSLTFTYSSGSPHPTDGGPLLDISKPAYTGTATGPGFTQLVSGGDNFLSVAYTGTSFPVSAWGISQAGTNSAANGKYQIGVTQTIAFTIGSSTNLAVGASVCLLGRSASGAPSSFTEETSITTISGSGGIGGTQTATFTTRKAYGTGFAIMQGPMCGKYLTNTGASNRTGLLVVGATSATNLIIAACTHGVCTSYAGQQGSIDLYQQVIGSVGNAHTFYPGAENIGTANNTPHTVQLAPNTVPWAPGDSIESPNPAAVNMTAVHALCGQTTPENDSLSLCMDVQYSGTAPINSIARVRIDSIAGAGVGSLLNLEAKDYTHSPVGYIQVSGKSPLQGIINGQALQSGVNIPWLHGPAGVDPVWASTADGHWEALKGTGWVGVLAANVPPIPSAVNHIVASVGTADGTVAATDYQDIALGANCSIVSAVFNCGSGTTLLTGTVALSGGSFDPGACDSNTVTVTGATIGHAVAVSTSDGTDVDAFGILTATVSAANTVKVRLCPIATATFAGKSYVVSTY